MKNTTFHTLSNTAYYITYYIIFRIKRAGLKTNQHKNKPLSTVSYEFFTQRSVVFMFCRNSCEWWVCSLSNEFFPETSWLTKPACTIQSQAFKIGNICKKPVWGSEKKFKSQNHTKTKFEGRKNK